MTRCALLPPSEAGNLQFEIGPEDGSSSGSARSPKVGCRSRVRPRPGRGRSRSGEDRRRSPPDPNSRSRPTSSLQSERSIASGLVVLRLVPPESAASFAIDASRIAGAPIAEPPAETVDADRNQFRTSPKISIGSSPPRDAFSTPSTQLPARSTAIHGWVTNVGGRSPCPVCSSRWNRRWP